MIYAAYFDESDQKPGFSLAGYSASYDTWVHLSWAWRDLLQKWKLEYFKASECENLLGQFAQYRDNPKDLEAELSREERTRLIKIKTEFVDAICKHYDDLQGYGAVVAVEDFERIVSENVETSRMLMDKPYYICFQLCLIAAAMPARDANLRRSKELAIRVKPFFDSHEVYSPLAKILFEKFKKKNPLSAEVLLPPSYEDDIQTPALQVADSLAYEARKLLATRIKNPNDEYMRKPMERLRPFIYRLYNLNYDALKQIVDMQPVDSIPVRHVRVEELW